MSSAPSWFPAAAPRPAAAIRTVSTATHTSDPDLRPKYVLLLEDADLDAATLRQMLESRAADFRLVRIRSLGELPAALDLQKFDLILLDLDVGGWGLDALRQTRAAVGEIPIVVLTSMTDAKLALSCIEAGAEEYLHKSELAPPLLDRALRHAIGRKRAREIDTWLEHSNRLTALGTLAAGIAHEVNNPATVAVMSAGIVQERLRSLGERTTDAESHALIEDALEVQLELLESLDRIRAAIRNVQSFARPQAELEELLDVGDLCRRARRIVAPELKERARYRERLESAAPVLGDARQLEQVIVNLLINATHAIPAGDSGRHVVGVETYMQGDSVVIAVTDTGAGIPNEVIGRIFEPFFTTKPRERGSGLGLWICSRIVARMGGQIRVSTEVGKGTRFEIVLPRAAGQAARSVTGDLAAAR